MDTVTHQPFDAGELLADAASQAAYFNEALATGHQELILHALNTIARARGMTVLAHETGLTRTALYSALGKGGNPTLCTLLALTNALGVRLKAESMAEREQQREMA
jgi:probable addiction module antidote protein